ncbi:hypothetical protein [Argonema antarcticum]|uniref:hypothetical protein n=1 Tax=Argonema antarcticum TaxID=2942763 RepID=UPI002013A761|nr:hypothetical protein [Argonema antarcticum]MCL1472871.1 hypothetical protein [Argonema antarcticum A004/B2]
MNTTVSLAAAAVGLAALLRISGSAYSELLIIGATLYLSQAIIYNSLKFPPLLGGVTGEGCVALASSCSILSLRSI